MYCHRQVYFNKTKKDRRIQNLNFKIKFGKLNKTTKGDLPMKSKKQYIFSQLQFGFSGATYGREY